MHDIHGVHEHYFSSMEQKLPRSGVQNRLEKAVESTGVMWHKMQIISLVHIFPCKNVACQLFYTELTLALDDRLAQISFTIETKPIFINSFRHFHKLFSSNKKLSAHNNKTLQDKAH